MLRASVVTLVGLVGCGAAHAPIERATRSSFEDPLAAESTSALPRIGGRDQAHDLLVALVECLVAEDEARAARLLDERLVSAAATNHGDAPGPRSALQRSAWVHQMVAAVHAARLAEGTTATSVIEAGSISVDAAASYYPEGGLPREVEPTDLVVRFRVAPAGRRALSGLAPSGQGLVVVRPGPDARVIAR